MAMPFDLFFLQCFLYKMGMLIEWHPLRPVEISVVTVVKGV